jgi:hypothetical protein
MLATSEVWALCPYAQFLYVQFELSVMFGYRVLANAKLV